jgi:hypothetical protein
MKTKKMITLRNVAIATSLMLVVSCNKKTETTDVSAIANDDNVAENAFYDMKTAGDNAGTESTQVQSLEKGIKDTTCVKVEYVNYDPNTKTGTLNLNFGETNCTCKDGKKRRGIIKVEYKGTDKLIGSQVVYIADKYFVNDYGLMGKKTVTYSDTFKFTIKVEGGVVTKPDGSKITWNSDRTRTMTAGQKTPYLSDDTYEITGTSSGVNAAGNPYSFETETALVKSMNCDYIKSGKLKIKRSGKKDATVDYGDGTCDDKGTLSVGSWTKDITVKKW